MIFRESVPLKGRLRLKLTLLVKCPVERNGGDQTMLLLVTVSISFCTHRKYTVELKERSLHRLQLLNKHHPTIRATSEVRKNLISATMLI